MEMYKKPIMKIVELEKVDVLTCSGCGNTSSHNPLATKGAENVYSDGCYADCTKQHAD